MPFNLHANITNVLQVLTVQYAFKSVFWARFFIQLSYPKYQTDIQHISFILTVNLGENMKFLETVIIVRILRSCVGTRIESKRPA